MGCFDSVNSLEGVGEPCDRFAFLVGGSSVEGVASESDGGVADFAAARAAWVTGRWIPRLGNERDFLLVLYGMLKTVDAPLFGCRILQLFLFRRFDGECSLPFSLNRDGCRGTLVVDCGDGGDGKVGNEAKDCLRQELRECDVMQV